MAIQKVEVPTSAERIIAVDGPTAAGKTTVCRQVSDRFGLAFLETGRVYRYLARMAVRRRLDPSDSERMLALHNSVNGNYFRALNSGGLDQKLRSPDVSEAVAILATLPVVRAALTDVVAVGLAIRIGASWRAEILGRWCSLALRSSST
jgi:cytidylate kinase